MMGDVTKKLMSTWKADAAFAWLIRIWASNILSVCRFFTALHLMQPRYSDEKAVRLSVCLSVKCVHCCIVTKWKKDLSRFLYRTKDHLA